MSGASSRHQHPIISGALATSDQGHHPDESLCHHIWTDMSQVSQVALTRRHLAPGDPWRIIVLLLNYKRGVYRDQVADILIINFKSLLPRWTQLKCRAKDYIKI